MRARGAPRQKWTPGAEGQVRVRVAGDVEPVGLREYGRIPVGGAQQGGDLLTFLDHHAAHLHRRRGGPLEQLQRGVEAEHLLDRRLERRPGSQAAPEHRGEPVAEDVDRGLVTGVEQEYDGGDDLVLGEPALGGRAAATRSLIRSSAGSSRRAATSSRTRSAKSVAAATAASTTAGGGDTSYIRTIACDQSRSCGAYDEGTPRSSAITSTGNGSAYSPTTSKPSGSTESRSEPASVLHPRPQPLDVAPVERPGHQSAQPGVLGRLVLHHLVAVEQVERFEVVGRRPVPPDPAQAPVAQDRPGRARARRSGTCPTARARPPGAPPARPRRTDTGRRPARPTPGQARSSGPNASGSTSSIRRIPETVHSSSSGPPFS